jgi:predicted Zn-dependent peptidase
VLRQQDFDPEIKVVMEERRQRTDDNPRNLAFERFKWIAYPTSHHRQPVIGFMKNLQNIRLDDLKHWYQTWYTPNNATLVIVGDVNSEQALKQVEKYFAAIPKKNFLIAMMCWNLIEWVIDIWKFTFQYKFQTCLWHGMLNLSLQQKTHKMLMH